MINLILAALPQLGQLVFGGKGDKVIAAATSVAQEVFGTSDETEIAKKMQTDPALAQQFKAKLEAQTAALQQEAEMYKLQIEDTKHARDSFAGNFNWPQFALGGIITAGFFVVLLVLVVHPITLSTEMLTVLTILLGWLGNSFGQVVNYHFGSSAGSAQKDGLINQIKQTIVKKM